MRWKGKKEEQVEEPIAIASAPEPEWHHEEDSEKLPVFDLSGDAFRAEEPPLPATEMAPQFEISDDGTNFPIVNPFIPDAALTQNSAALETITALSVRLGSFTATFPLVKDVTTLGRPDSEAGIYPDIELELDDAISRRHAEIRKRGDQFFLVDVGSANGTRLNGETLTPNQEMPLASGDRIRLGDRTEIVCE